MFPNYYADSLSYSSFYPMMMQMMNYQMPYNYGYPMGNVAFLGNTQRQQAPNSVISEAATQVKKDDTQLIGINVKTGEMENINIYEVSPEKLEDYKTNLKKLQKKENQKTILTILAGLATVAGGFAIGAYGGPKLCKALKIKPNSTLESLLGTSPDEQSFMCGIGAGLLSALGFGIYEETRSPATAEKMIKETLGEPLKA